ncbi:phosphoribosylaminoimidazole carboxylase [Malassezia vespertilionis]|uniref:Phosphoribosylaminoimidazole carboxylase n=1 Tax=Malassezia vespertilionis TaxID=2020962 RepID=A0A2N1JD07_9BASI|nr:phosphoribosylaminoimidazole carboxylase [Malassezia vespertilionis]PKI84450.1 Ade2p [Malassezia vespertilionis]WFD06422.1 phosphoribosylaminoimidazole carboxylase [Malassezia vespertilionis]
MDSTIVGVLGGGQLGRMFAEAASRLNIAVRFLDVGANTPAKQIVSVPNDLPGHVDGSFSDAAQIRALAKKVDVLTVEIEHVDADQLEAVLEEGLVRAVHPSPATIKLIQDKYLQKVHLQDAGLPVVEFSAVDTQNVDAAIDRFGLPLMLKCRTQAYDGRGNFTLRTREQIPEAISALGGGTRPLYAEKWASFEKELAVMVVRSTDGDVRAYTAVETVHENSICHSVYAPLRVPVAGLDKRARDIAERAVATFSGAGIFGVEMFLLPGSVLVINEIAPRPHNSGHYTMEASDTTQFENHLRAVVGMPLGSTALKVPSAAMLNILGLADMDKDKDALAKTLAPAIRSLSVPGTTVHLYGKQGCRIGRKLGHINVVGKSDAAVRERMGVLLDELALAKASAESGAPWNAEAAKKRVVSSPASPVRSADDFSNPSPLVGVIMGSDSDLVVMMAAAQVLKQFDVPFELTIVSAHRTPERMAQYAQSARARGLGAIIAGAGGAAHLPGMVAAQTCLPVIGVPVKGSSLDGVDSLHSIVQMPRGIPVATVAINNSMNAALLAIRILGTSIPSYLDKIEEYMKEMERSVHQKVECLYAQAWDYQVPGK